MNANHIAVHAPSPQKGLFDAFAAFASAGIAAYNAAHPTMPISFATVGKGDAIYTPACYIVNEDVAEDGDLSVLKCPFLSVASTEELSKYNRFLQSCARPSERVQLVVDVLVGLA